LDTLPTSLPLIYANEREFVYREKFCTKQAKWKYRIGKMSNVQSIYIYIYIYIYIRTKARNENDKYRKQKKNTHTHEMKMGYVG